MIIEFCHIAGVAGNSISVIMEFTGIQRNECFMKDNMKDYLYITPIDCMADTNEQFYNPLLERKNNFYRYLVRTWVVSYALAQTPKCSAGAGCITANYTW